MQFDASERLILLDDCRISSIPQLDESGVRDESNYEHDRKP
jgi:hypothetical protein